MQPPFHCLPRAGQALGKAYTTGAPARRCADSGSSRSRAPWRTGAPRGPHAFPTRARHPGRQLERSFTPSTGRQSRTGAQRCWRRAMSTTLRDSARSWPARRSSSTIDRCAAGALTADVTQGPKWRRHPVTGDTQPLHTFPALTGATQRESQTGRVSETLLRNPSSIRAPPCRFGGALNTRKSTGRPSLGSFGPWCYAAGAPKARLPRVTLPSRDEGATRPDARRADAMDPIKGCAPSRPERVEGFGPRLAGRLFRSRPRPRACAHPSRSARWRCTAAAGSHSRAQATDRRS